MTKDLDWSDVVADAQHQMDAYLGRIWLDIEKMPDHALGIYMYRLGIQARTEGDTFTIACLRMAEQVHIVRITDLCEGCLGRYGCDMCQQFDFTAYDYPEFDSQ